MIKSVHVPVYCDKLDLKYGALLVFKTIRVGFPTFPIFVHWHGLLFEVYQEVREYCEKLNITIVTDNTFMCDTNDVLLRKLVSHETDGFVICDSDVVFFESVEGFIPNQHMAGEYIEKFLCPIANAVTFPRLHTALMFIRDASELRYLIENKYTPVLKRFCPLNPFRPVVTFINGQAAFHDSASILFNMLSGESFDKDMLNKYEHIYSGSYASHIPNLVDFHKKVYTNPSLAKGFREIVMNKFYETRSYKQL